MSFDDLTWPGPEFDAAPPSVTVSLGPEARHGDIPEAVSLFASEVWSNLAEPDWAEWLESPDPVVDVTIDPEDVDEIRVYAPGDPDAPPPTGFDLARRPGRFPTPAGHPVRAFHVTAGSTSDVLMSALQQCVDLIISYAVDAPEVVEEWVNGGAECAVIEM